MSEIIVLGGEKPELRNLASVVRELGFEVQEARTSNEIESVLTAHPVAFCVLDSTLGLDVIRDVTKTVWQTSPEAGLLVLCESQQGAARFESLRFDGIDLFLGPHALQEVVAFLREAVLGTVKPSDEFHILYVEDLDSPREIVTLYLKDLGFERVTGVRNAEDALAALRAEPALFDCVLTDYKMPRMNGVQFTRELRTTEGLHRLPIVMLTAVGTEVTLRQSIRAGISGFLVKPPRKMDLLREMNRARRIACGRAQVRLVPVIQFQEFEKTLAESPENSPEE